MYRFVFLLMLLLAGGCRNRPSQLDPFIGRTTVPPPPTGSVGPSNATGVAYPAAPPSFNSGTTSPGTTAPSTIPPAAPPGSFTPNMSTPPPQPLSSAVPPNTVPSGAAPPGANTPYQFTGGGSAIRVVPPDPNKPSSFNTSNGGIDIMQLPVKGQGTRPAAPPTNSTSLPVTPVSAAAGQTGNFGFDPTYSQLSGRLEYSSLDGRWLLRYVAPQTKADPYGGVAVLVPQGSMAGFNNGDFVNAQGRLQADGSASPVFTASALSLQRSR
jgi:hypothetical protein